MAIPEKVLTHHTLLAACLGWRLRRAGSVPARLSSVTCERSSTRTFPERVTSSPSHGVGLPAFVARAVVFTLRAKKSVKTQIPPASAAWYFSFNLEGQKQQRFLDTTDFSRVEFQFQNLPLHRRRRPKLKPHTTKVGVSQPITRRSSRLKLKYTRHKAGGIPKKGLAYSVAKFLLTTAHPSLQTFMNSLHPFYMGGRNLLC